MLALQHPSPWRCSEQAVCTKVAVGLCPSRKFGQLVEKLGRGRHSFFFLRKPDQSEGTARNTGVCADQPWGTRKAAQLDKAEKLHRKKMFPVEIVDSPSSSCRVEE